MEDMYLRLLFEKYVFEFIVKWNPVNIPFRRAMQILF